MSTFFLAPWWDKIINAMRSKEVNPISQHYVSETLVDATFNATDAYYYYVDMAGYRKGGFQFDATIGVASSGTIKIYGTLQDDGTAPSGCTYVDITSDTFGVSSLALAAGDTDDLWVDNSEKLACYKYLQIEFDYTDAADSTLAIYHTRLY